MLFRKVSIVNLYKLMVRCFNNHINPFYTYNAYTHTLAYMYISETDTHATHINSYYI